MENHQVEVCITVYQRYYRLPEIIRQLNKQDEQGFNLNIWNNSGKDLTPFITEFPADRLQVINSEKNEGSAARFKIIPKTTGQCIIFIDDDESIDPRFVSYMKKVWELHSKDCICGWYTRTFINDRYNPSYDDPPVESEVDYVGTGGMVLDRWIFDNEPTLQDIPKPFDKTEDLYLCYIARMKYGMHLIKTLPLVSILVDGKDQFVNINKEDIFLRLKSMGWKLVRNMMLKEQAFKNIVDFQKVMNELKIPFWLSEGLLLGLYREKDCILGDEDDVDVCLWNEYADRSDEIIRALESIGFQLLNDWKLEGDTSEGIAMTRNGSKIDIIFTRKNDKEVFFLARNFGNMGEFPYFAFVFPKELYDEFGEIQWRDVKFPCPKNIEGYLTARYGDWKTPKLRGIDYHADSFEDNPCYKINWNYKNGSK